MVADHRLAQRRRDRRRLGRIAPVGPGRITRRLGGQAGLIEQLVALQHPLFVPGRAVQRKGQPRPRHPPHVLAGPGHQGRPDALVDQVRPTPSPVLPGKEPRPGRPHRIGRQAAAGRRRQGQIAHRHHPRRPGPDLGPRRIAPPVAEGVELLDIAKLESRLAGYELPQRQFEGPVAVRFERPERQPRRCLRPHGQHHGLAVADGDDDGGQADDDGRVHGSGPSSSSPIGGGGPPPKAVVEGVRTAGSAETGLPAYVGGDPLRPPLRVAHLPRWGRS